MALSFNKINTYIGEVLQNDCGILEIEKKGSDLIKSGVYSTYSNYENVDDLLKSLTERAKILNHPGRTLNGFPHFKNPMISSNQAFMSQY